MRIGVQVLLLAASLFSTGCPSGIIADGDTKVNGDLHALAATLNEFKRLNGRFPTAEEGLTPLVERKLLLVIPNDPWGRSYRYVVSSGKRGYDLYSLGQSAENSSDDIHLE